MRTSSSGDGRFRSASLSSMRRWGCSRFCRCHWYQPSVLAAPAQADYHWIWLELFGYPTSRTLLSLWLLLPSPHTHIITTGNARAFTPLFQGKMPEFYNAVNEVFFELALASAVAVLAGMLGSYVRLKWRGAIVKELHRRMLSRNNLLNYLSNIDQRVDNIDQRMTQDVEVATSNAWDMAMGMIGGIAAIATSISTLVSSGPLPVLSIFLYALILVAINAVMSPVVRLQLGQQLKEGAFRLVHTRKRVCGEHNISRRESASSVLRLRWASMRSTKTFSSSS